MFTIPHRVKHAVLIFANLAGLFSPALLGAGLASAGHPVHRAAPPSKLYAQLLQSDQYGIEAAENANEQETFEAIAGGGAPPAARPRPGSAGCR